MKIVVNEARLHYLPATTTFPVGVRLLPNVVNNVPDLYWQELEAREVVSFDYTVEPPKKGKRFPGRDAIAMLTSPDSILVPRPGEASTFGPQITVYADDQMKDTVMPDPVTLATYGLPAAQIIIDETTNRKSLERWSRERPVDAKTKAIAAYASTRLAALGGG